MKARSIYLVLCVAGAVIPYLQFVPWVAENGLHVRLMIQELFANRISAFFAAQTAFMVAACSCHALRGRLTRVAVGALST